MAMHSSFPDWYRSAGLAPQATLLEGRWAAIEELTSESTAALVVELAQLFAAPTSQDGGLDTFREAFRKHDPVFPSKDNLQELRVLAGATLRVLIDQEDSLAPLAALGIVCGSFGPRLSAVPEPEHVDAAQRFLVRFATKTRASGDTPTIELPASLTAKAKIAKALQEGHFNSPPSLREPLIGLLNELLAGLATVAEQAQEAVNDLSHVAAVRQEETGVLWWLHSRLSSSTEKPFSEVGYIAGALVFAFELAELTSFVPGPEALPAVVVRSLQEAGAPSSTEAITIANATNALTRDLRERISAKKGSEVPVGLTPVLLAISKSLDTDGPEDWLPVYRKVSDIPLERPFPASSVCLQLFRELMLLRASSEAQ